MNHIYPKEIAQLPPYNHVLREGLLLKRLSVLAAGSTTVEENEEEIVESPQVQADPSHLRKHSAKPDADDEESMHEADTTAPAVHKDLEDAGSQAPRNSGGSAVKHLKKVGKVLQRKPVQTKYKPKIAKHSKTSKAKLVKSDSKKTTDGKKVQVSENIELISSGDPLS